MFGFQPLLAIVSHIFFTGVAFYALQALMLEKIIKKKPCLPGAVLFILLSIMIGMAVSNFFLEISYWSRKYSAHVQLMYQRICDTCYRRVYDDCSEV